MRHKITFQWWEAVVEIDDTPETEAAMKEQVLFWRRDVPEDVKKAYLSMLAVELIRESTEWSLPGVLEAFDSKEGWLPLCGEHGVTLIEIDSWVFDGDDFDFEEEKGK